MDRDSDEEVSDDEAEQLRKDNAKKKGARTTHQLARVWARAKLHVIPHTPPACALRS